MKRDHRLQVPAVLGKARRELGISQKELAARAGMRQSQLCGLEIGRAVLHGQAHLQGLQDALSEIPGTVEQLWRAAQHDRLLTLLVKFELSGAQQTALSRMVQALQLMNDSEAEALGEKFIGIYQTKTWLTPASHS